MGDFGKVNVTSYMDVNCLFSFVSTDWLPKSKKYFSAFKPEKRKPESVWIRALAFLLLIMSVTQNPLIACKLSENEARYERELDQSNVVRSSGMRDRYKVRRKIHRNN
jgi:hypothetical protein